MDIMRRLPWDWYSGVLPDNVVLDEGAYLETTYSFLLYRSRAPVGLRVGRGSAVYTGTMLDMGLNAKVSIGEYVLINSAWIISDLEVEIGDYALISWRVVLMDTYRVPLDPLQRRRLLQRVPANAPRRIEADTPANPIRIGRNTWIGFDACILPGVTVGEGSIVGARSVVTEDVPPYTVAAGNPARIIRRLDMEEINDGSVET